MTISTDLEKNNFTPAKLKPTKTLVDEVVSNFIELNLRISWLSPLLVLVTTWSCYLLSNNYTPSNPLHMFVALSYNTNKYDELTHDILYKKGIRDFAFIVYHMVFFTFLRQFVMEVILRPLAIYCNMKTTPKIVRFMEQTYSIFYYSLSSPAGFYVMYHMPIWYFNTYEFYNTYPHRADPFYLKLFYLLQASFWSQQAAILILQLEKPRKDFKELVFHHIVTMLLIYLSYTFHFTWIGVTIYSTMDTSDLFLATSKVLNYLDSKITGLFFAIFIFVWIYERHYLNLKILYSILTEFKTVGPYDLNFKTGQYKCFISQPIVFFLLSCLQLVNLYWLFLILKIAFRFLFSGKELEDVRSDAEDEDEDKTYDQKIHNDKKQLNRHQRHHNLHNKITNDEDQIETPLENVKVQTSFINDNKKEK
ncbi:TLC domain-containing protein [Ascoidea rubescens DSM 1968]|uniref:Ceramide synthase component n=1 Tax=Ascoidea rubescens DSM 1968 TaxID=1344418 RepID=A0A1D2VE98_9ASCO|nr:ceramide synthase component [Ascoidea rubescens DSM 1968]ODV59929.1 ceramide synthase component [Ascoidea rubescens DSM 1968]